MTKHTTTSFRSAVATLAIAFCLAICSLPFAAQSAYAAGAFDNGGSSSNAPLATEQVSEHNAGNLFLVAQGVSDAAIENDLYWVGQTLASSKLEVGTSGHGSILAAGQSVELKNVTVADSVRVAASQIVLEHAQIGNNITTASQSLSIGNEVSANGIYAAAQTLSIAGTYKGGFLSGESVTFNGVVEGDLTIAAETITIGKNAQVNGELSLPEGANVDIADGAQVPNVSYNAPYVESAEPSMFDNLITILYACMAHIVLVGLFFLFIRKSLVKSANMARKSLVKMLLAGLVIFIVAPIVCLLLIFPLITVPVVVLLVLLMIIIALFSLPFTGSALGLMLLGKRMNPVLAAVIGTVVLTIFAYVPILSTLTVIFCIMFTAGYLWCSFWEDRQERKRERLAGQQVQPAPPTGDPVVPPTSSDAPQPGQLARPEQPNEESSRPEDTTKDGQ